MVSLEGLLLGMHTFAKKTADAIADISTSIEVWYQLRGFRSFVKAGIPAVSLAVVPIYGSMTAGCGEEEQPCDTTADCDADRYCSAEGVCVGSGYEGTEENIPENPCGNSPVFGKYLWEINSCGWSMHMGDDCVVGAKGLAGAREGEYNYSLPNWGGMTTYYGLSIYFADDSGAATVLNPDLRFSPDAGDQWRQVNAKLEQYGGYVLQGDCSVDNLDDCVVRDGAC